MKIPNSQICDISNQEEVMHMLGTIFSCAVISSQCYGVDNDGGDISDSILVRISCLRGVLMGFVDQNIKLE